jgi:hypothetical protein
LCYFITSIFHSPKYRKNNPINTIKLIFVTKIKPNYERVKTVLKENNMVTETRYFLGDYEIQIKYGITRELIYVDGPNGLCAINIKATNALNPENYVPYTDYLGNINTITDNGGNIIA